MTTIDGVDRCLQVRLPCEHDTDHIRVMLPSLGKELRAVHARHLEVCDNRRERTILDDCLETRSGATGRDEGVVLAMLAAQAVEDGLFVIDEKDTVAICVHGHVSLGGGEGGS